MKIIKLLLLPLFLLTVVNAEKIKDISSVIGVRENQIIGYGLVVGLAGTGDGTSNKFTAQSVSNLLQGMNVKIDPNDIKSKNVAAVMVTAALPPFARQGDQVDVMVSSIGDAKSIQGGTLLMTPLKGVDGKIYGLAQGPVGIGGRNEGGGAGGNHPSAGLILKGAVVEREVAYNLYNQPMATLSLENSNFMNAVAVQNTINRFFSASAVAIDPKTIRVKRPDDMSMVEFLASINELEITYDREQKVVIDERTGTIVAGIDITVEPVVITQGDITVKINYPETGQAGGGINMGDGVNIDANTNTINSANRPTVANIARSLQKLGAAPKDIISIIEAMKKAGAITATVKII